MPAIKVAITDYRYDDLRIETELLAAAGIELIAGSCKTEEDVIRLAQHADGIIVNYAPITAAVIGALERCRIISRNGVGINNVDVEAASARGIYVANVPDYGVEEVSNHAFAMVLHYARKITGYDAAIRSGVWDYKACCPLRRLSAQTLGLLGFGRIPRRLAEKAAAFRFNVLVYDPYVSEDDIRAYGARPATCDEICRLADYISVHVPLAAETRLLINAERLRTMKPNAVIVNTSRGAIIDEAALADALRGGRIGGAALDVLENEPIAAGHPLLGLDNVVLTPHCAWYSEEAMIELRTKAAQNTADVLTGKHSPYIVNRSAANGSAKKGATEGA
ncbi:MAG: C-terminal binding protein [Paenibacillaceae bacterium]|nr:C-terminal binding protein [Paenibacillaceae bacterium]